MGKINLQADAQEFLFYSYFGETWDSLKCKKESNEEGKEEDAIYVCFKCAYGDFKRTVLFDGKTENDDFPHDMYYGESRGENVGEKLYGKFTKLLNTTDSEFKKDHKALCDAMVKNADADKVAYVKEFYYGQAQKWVNMTLKYMRMTGLWEDKFSRIDSVLHVPLDRIILKATFHKKTRIDIDPNGDLIVGKINCVNCDGAILSQDAKFKGDYPEGKDGKVKPVVWSKISTYDDYMIIQGMIKECIPEGDYKKHPLDWENKVWLAASRVKPGN